MSSSKFEKLTMNAFEVLSALPNGPCLLVDISRTCKLTARSSRTAVAELERHHLVKVYRIGRSLIVEQANSKRPRNEVPNQVPIADLDGVFGTYRGDVLEIVGVLGTVRRDELVEGLRNMNNAGNTKLATQRIQKAIDSGLIEPDPFDRAQYRLSTYGHQTWQHIRKFRKPNFEQDMQSLVGRNDVR